jgi:cob(I)alamin adenosyltransferase
MMSNKNTKHKQAMQKQKANVDASIAQATIERGVLLLLTGNGKGKSSSAFGMVMRALGYGYKVGVVQFIKGAQSSGEAVYLQKNCPEVDFYAMGTGFTWESQDRTSDIAAAENTWAVISISMKIKCWPHWLIVQSIKALLSPDAVAVQLCAS